jgi:hypothetical protein
LEEKEKASLFLAVTILVAFLVDQKQMAKKNHHCSEDLQQENHYLIIVPLFLETKAQTSSAKRIHSRTQTTKKKLKKIKMEMTVVQSIKMKMSLQQWHLKSM